MARILVVHSALKIFVLLIFIGKLYFVHGQKDLHNFLEVRLDDFPEKNISAKCLSEMRLMKKSLQNLTFWAVEMWEATARESPSLLEGTNYHFGNFDECVVPVKTGFEKGPERQYCLVKINIKFDFPRNTSDKHSIYDPYGSSLNIIYGNGEPSMVERDEVFWAVCVPASCSPPDVVTMIDNHFDTISDKARALNLSLSTSLDDKWCHQDTTQDNYTPGAIAFICVLCILCVIAIACTAYHWYIEYGRETENKKVQCPAIVKCFSIVFHLNQLNYKSKGEAGLEALNSIKVMAICFVIVGHRVGTLTQGPSINRKYHEREFYTMRGAIVRQTDVFVDMFFIISGILAMYNLLKRTEKTHVNYGLIIFLRYLRLVPLYAFAIFFTATLLPTTGTGPLWKPIMEGEANYCRENWWANILMIHNYINVERMCMLHAWYISCDFQFFVLCVFACFVLKRNEWRKIGLILLGVLLVISILIPILVTYFMNLHATLFFYYKFLIAPRMDPTFQLTYITSYARSSPYILGMFGGYILYKFHKPGEKRFSRMTATLGGVSSIIIFLVFIFSTWKVYKVGYEISPIASAIFSGFHRPIKSFLTCMLILFCVFGNIPFISSFLGWKPWLVLSKLTYGAYLFHMSLQLRDAAMLRQPFFFEYVFMYFKLSLGDIFASFLMSFLFYITVEGPSNQILRAIMAPPNSKRKENSSMNGHTNDALELEKQDKA